MKRKLLICLTAFMLMSGTAYAASAINGLYHDREIVKVTVNGKEIKSSVPGQVIDGATMLPLRAIADALGATVGWDNNKYLASITTQQEPAKPVETGLTLEQLNKIGESVGLVYIMDAANKNIGTGSAFVVNGTMVTNWHVAEKATSLVVEFGTKVETLQVKDAVFKNVDRDLIGFKLDGVQSLTLNTQEPAHNSKVYTLGFPHHKFTITEGEFYDKSDNSWFYSAKIDHGSSGGIAINAKGEVIGVSAGGLPGNLWNLAVKAEHVQNELNKLK